MKTKSIILNILIALGFIVGVQLVGFLGALMAGDTSQVYSQLTKPPLSPPSVVFSIVWPILFLLIGLSIFFVWRSDSPIKKQYYFLSAAQLFFNFFWTAIFFKWELRLLALVDLIIIIFLVIALLSISYKENKLSFWMTIPYLLWLMFALYLNFGFILLNGI